MLKKQRKITTNDNQNSNKTKKKKQKKIKSSLYIRKSLFSKCTNPIKIQMLNMLVIKLLDSFFNIKPKWCHSLECASPVDFPLR